MLSARSSNLIRQSRTSASVGSSRLQRRETRPLPGSCLCARRFVATFGRGSAATTAGRQHLDAGNLLCRRWHFDYRRKQSHAAVVSDKATIAGAGTNPVTAHRFTRRAQVTSASRAFPAQRATSSVVTATSGSRPSQVHRCTLRAPTRCKQNAEDIAIAPPPT